MIGKNIKDLRESLTLTQDQLAIDLEISQGYLSNLEKGKRTPSLPLTIKIAEVLNTKIETLLAL